MSRTVAKPNRHPVENVAVPVDVHLLRDLEAFLGRLADPGRTEFSFAAVCRQHRAVEGLLAEHAIRKEREMMNALRSARVSANRLQRQVFQLEGQLHDERKQSGRGDEERPSARKLEAVR